MDAKVTAGRRSLAPEDPRGHFFEGWGHLRNGVAQLRVQKDLANFLRDPAFENGTHVTSMKTGAAKERDTARLTLFIGLSC